MNYPLISEYIEAIKAAEDNFEQLKNLRPVLDEDGEPIMTSGNFAVVFKMKDEQTGKLHAVKCFLKEQEGRAEAYRMIAEELEYVNSTFLTPIKYLDKELFVDSSNSEDSEFPVLLMDWVEGITLDKYIRQHIGDQYELSLLAYQFSRLAMWLMPQPFAHGDLNPDNILVKDDGTLVLVDYDGMYVPAMKGQKARELGSPDFRHPGRTEEVFDEHIDDFSLASILLSLKAIALQPDLLEEYGASDRLLFSEKDYRNLSESSALGALQPLMQDAELASLYSLYILALSKNNLSQVSFRLFNLNRPDRSQYEDENLSTEVTEEDWTNAWTDEYGVMYSADKRRLLYAPDYLTYYVIKEGTQIICDSAFVNYGFEDVDYQYVVDSGQTMWDFIKDTSKLKAVSIPNSVVKIGKDVFDFCDNLELILIPIATRTKFEKYLHKWGNVMVETPYSLDFKCVVYMQIRQCAYKLFICFDDKVKKDLNEDLLLNELTLLATALVLNVEDERIKECIGFVKQKIFDDYLSVKNIDDYDSWIVCNTPGMSSNDLYSTNEAISLVEFEKENGQVTFYKGKINAYPYDDSFWGEFVDKNGKKQIVYVDQGFPFNYNVSELKKNKSVFGIVKEKNIHYQSDDFSYCLKEIKKEHSMLRLYINERISFYKKAIVEVLSNIKNYRLYIYQLYNIVTNEILNYNDPYFGVVDLEFGDEVAFNNADGTICHYSAISLNHFSSCFSEKLEYLRQGEEENLSTEVTDEDLANAWTDEYGVKYSADKKRLLEVPMGFTEYSIKQGVKVICTKAFYKANLKKIRIPNSVVKIGRLAFSGCGFLDSIIIPSSVVSIGGGSFSGCKNITSIYIPKSVIHFPTADPFTGLETTSLFDGCNKLSSIIVEEGNPAFDSRDNCNAIIDSESMKLIAGCKKTIIPESVTSIGVNAFSFCSGLTAIHIPNTVTSIDNRAFMGCINLNYILFPDSLKIIKEAAFLKCYSLSHVIIPKSVTEIQRSAFMWCSGLNSITILNPNIAIGPAVFTECKSLSKIFIPQGTIVRFKEMFLNNWNADHNDFYRLLVEQNSSWVEKSRRAFTQDVIAAVERAEVVASQYGNSVCFIMKSGAQTYIPLSQNSSLTVGDTIDLKAAKLITLCREGEDDIYRVIE